MSYDPSNPTTRAGYGEGRMIDAGLQSYMQSVYHTMGLGLALTGLTAYAVANVPALFNLIFHTPLSWVVMIAPLGIIWFGFTPARINSMSVDRLMMIFSIFSVVMGMSLAAIFQVYSGASIARVFFITAATFAGTSLYGYTTKRDLTGMGSFMAMGLIGLVIAGFVNIFMMSPMVYFVTSVISVAVFTGLTAWETQSLKLTYNAGATEANAKMAIAGALNLYINFINLFMTILRLTGDRK